MSFFGLPQRSLENEKRMVLERGLDNSEDVAVYTWGEDSYDGLGDALQEGGDELNDETFGGVGNVGKDFDFSQPTLPDIDKLPRSTQPPQEQAPVHQSNQYQASHNKPSQPPHPAAQSLESIWDDASPFSALQKPNGGANRGQEQHRYVAPTPPPATKFSPFGANESLMFHHQRSIGQGVGHPQQPRVRTLQEIEEEMLAAAQQNRQRERERQRELELQLLQQQQQQQLLQQQQQLRQEQEQRRLMQEQEIQQLQQRELQQRDLQQQRYHEQQQHQLQRLLLQQQQQQHLQQQRTPPPRMLPVSQSPRFLEHHRQQAILLQQQERQEQLLIQERERQEQLLIQERERHEQLLQDREQRQLQEILKQQRFEDRDKRMVLNMSADMKQNHHNWPGFIQRGEVLDLENPTVMESLQRQYTTPSPPKRYPGTVQEAVPSHQPHTVQLQLQQRIASEIAQAEFARELQGAPHPNQEVLRMEAMRKILEAEKMEEKRRRKAAKIAHMSRYNDLMTQSDKDFITRIQVSQLVTQDPYADDFYAQVYGAILRSRMGLQSQDERVIKFGSGGGIGLGLAQKGANRRPSAMQRMEQQVERIVNNARKREEEKGLHSLHSLQGALGKTSGRSYKAAPRQLLQVDSNPGSSPVLSPAHAHISKVSAYNEGAAKEAAKLGREALGDAAHVVGDIVRKEPLTHRQSLAIIEYLYDHVLKVEQLRRDQPHPEDEPEAFEHWKREYDGSVDEIWQEMRVMVPLETSNPHPFISLLGPTKGKKILPRLTRHLGSERMLTLLTLLVACFDQLDVIKRAPLLDSLVESPDRDDVERQTQAFLGSVMQSILPVVSVAELRLVTGLLSLLLHRTNIVAVAQTRPGLALLTLFLSRVEVIKQTMASGTDIAEIPTVEESQAWQLMFDHLFQLLAPHLLLLFPSTRIAHTNITGQPPAASSAIDIVDQPVWQFLAALALHAVVEQHQILVTTLREKVLDNVLSVNKGWVADEDERQTKLANVNLFLHALGLDSSQIAL